MRSNSSVSLGGGRGSAPAGYLTLTAPVDAAVEFLMVKKDFQAALDTCEKGLKSLGSFPEQEESCFKYAELKAALTIVGIQALAELNQWREILSWVIQQYGETEKIPAKIIQMCILLYVKVDERAVMKNVVCDWLHCSGNVSQSGFSTVAELYFLHILVPMGHMTEAVEMLESDVGRVAFTDEQRHAAQSLIDIQNEKNASSSKTNPESVDVATAASASKPERMTQRMSSIMRLLYRGLSVAGWRIRSISLRRVFLAVILVYLLLVRIDPDVRGLYNYNLSCCVNALLQSFSATTELLDILTRWQPSNSIGRNNVPLQLRNTLESMRDKTHRGPHRDFLESLYHHAIRRGTQQDADEIFHIILNLSEKQMPEPCVAQEIRSLYEIKVETHVTCSACNSIDRVPSSLFSLPLAIHEGENTLDSCIKSFFKRQSLREGDTCFCVQCDQKQPATHEQKLVSLPPILCVHLKRFRNDRGFTRKLHSKVSFHEMLNTGLFAAVRTENFVPDSGQADERYILYAVIVHNGTAMFGHYTAFIRPRQDRMWFYANDNTVTPATWADVQDTYKGNDTAYLLLYRKQSLNSSG